jgi:hypothetical protein
MNNKHLLQRAALVLLLACGCGGAGAAGRDPAEDAVRRVHDRIGAEDCAGAVSLLNAGLAAGYPEVQLLAGSMYDAGVCVKRNWERAVHFYVLADGGGQQAAAARLAAGYAAPENGPDIAAALWWGGREKHGVGRSICRVSDHARGDPDRFVAELRQWPPALQAACNYVTGVMMTLVGELRYPGKALQLAISGTVVISFEPAVPRIDVQTTGTEEENLPGLVAGDALRDRKSSTVKRAFEAEVRKIGERALKRYPQPAGVPSDWHPQVRVVFGFTPG